MNQNKPIDNHTRDVKRRKLNGQRNENEIQSSDIFKLPVEILEYIFDYLSLRDLNTVGETCKWIQRIAGQCYQKNYSGLSPIFSRNGRLFIRMGKQLDQVDMNNFLIRIVDKIRIAYLDNFKDFCNRNRKFHQLRKLILMDFVLPNVKIRLKGMRKIFCNLEGLQMYYDSLRVIDETHLENLLSLTPNIKLLTFRGIVTGNKWLMRKYPALEHCQIDHSYSTDILPIAKFLELNPTIHSFGIDSRNLWENRDSMKVSQIELNNLDIILHEKHTDPNRIEKFQSLCHLLNELYRLGRYKRLTLYVRFDYGSFEQKLVDEMTKLNVLTKVNIHVNTKFSEHVTLAHLKQLEEMSIPDSRFIKDIESFSNYLGQLERIHFGRSNLDHIMLFISRRPKLKKIRVDWFLSAGENIEFHQIINLSALNRGRAKLLHAEKVTLYVSEDVFLATKRAKRETDLDLIKLNRWECDEWDYNYKYSYTYVSNWSNTGKLL